jgi:hypothetical protein
VYTAYRVSIRIRNAHAITVTIVSAVVIVHIQAVVNCATCWHMRVIDSANGSQLLTAMNASSNIASTNTVTVAVDCVVVS